MQDFYIFTVLYWYFYLSKSSELNNSLSWVVLHIKIENLLLYKQWRHDTSVPGSGFLALWSFGNEVDS